MSSLRYFPRAAFLRLQELDLRGNSRAGILADMCRVNVLYMIKLAGSGHIGTSLSSMDIISWLYVNRDIGRLDSADGHDLFFSSKGHDVPAHYAVMLALGLLDFDSIHRLRRLGGLPGHPDVHTQNILTNTGSLGMGISKAKGFLKAADMDGGRVNAVFVMTGDGELQEGQLWESLISAANNREGRLIVIVDHNKLQSDTLVSVVSDLGDLRAKFESFGWHVERCNGHDMDSLAKSVDASLAARHQPSVILADTVKGKGVSFMEPTGRESVDELYRFHSGAPDDTAYDNAVKELLDRLSAKLSAHAYELGELGPMEEKASPPASAPGNHKQRLVDAYSQALLEAGRQDPDVVVLDGDLMLDCGLIPFRREYADRFIECGIAEQDMVSQAGGLALAGKLPIVHSFSCFLSTRPNEQIYNNATEGTKVIYTAPLAGVLPAGPGHSHQSVRDISALGAIPGLVLLAPASEKEVHRTVEYCVDRRNQTSFFIRLTSLPCEIPYGDSFANALEAGVGEAILEGSDAAIIAYGPVMLTQAWTCAEMLRSSHGLKLKVLNLPWLNMVDPAWLERELEGVRYLFTVDDHYYRGGQGEMVAAAIAASPAISDVRVHGFGLTSVPACGANDEVLRHHGLDAGSLCTAIRSFMDL